MQKTSAFTVPNVARLKERGDVAALSSVLLLEMVTFGSSDKLQQAKLEALAALGELKDQGCVEAVVEAATQWRNHPEVALMAVEVLGECGGSKAIQAINRVLSTLTFDGLEETRMRLGCVKALEHIGGSRAVEMLFGQLWRARDKALQEACETALDKLAGPDTYPCYMIQLHSGRDLDDLQNHDSGKMRRASEVAQRALGSIRSPEGFRLLFEGITHPGNHSVEALEDLLIRLLNAESLPVLQRLYQEHYARTASGLVLKKYHKHAALLPLFAALRDDKASLDRLAARMLGEIGDKAAVQPLIDCLKRQHGDAAAEALGKIDDPHAIVPMLAFEDKAADKAAAAVLRRHLHEMQAEELAEIAGLRDFVRSYSIQGLESVSDAAGDPYAAQVVSVTKQEHVSRERLRSMARDELARRGQPLASG